MNYRDLIREQKPLSTQMFTGGPTKNEHGLCEKTVHLQILFMNDQPLQLY